MAQVRPMVLMLVLSLLLVGSAELAWSYTLTVNSGTGDGSYGQGAVVSIAADAAPSGKQFNMWGWDWGTIADKEDPTTTFTMPARDAVVTASYRDIGAPKDWWPWFNGFCNQFFGAEREPLAYEMFGNDLVFMSRTGSEWSYVSQTSASVAFETNLPAKSYVEYGQTTGYGDQTLTTDRYHYLHLHYLRDLLPDTLYHYRYVAEDERGNIIASSDKTFTTATPPNVIYVPAGVSGPPYNLNQANRTYLVTEDLVCNRTAFNVSADNVTIDLGGHTVVYNEEDYQVTSDYTGTSAFGVKIYDRSNVDVLNGIIKQGAGASHSDIDGIGYNPLFMYHGYGDIAGLTIEYIGSQLTGICTHYTTGYDVHHNVIIDRGEEIADRQQAVHGIRECLSIHHNLLKRVRHCGISVCNNGVTYANEIYVDSCDTNSFAINHYKTVNAVCHDNRIFGQGYLVIGIGTVSAGVADIDVHDNYVHLQACEPDTRATEYGDQSGAYCTRVTWGGDNINYHDNVLVTYGRDEGMVRGVWACPQPNIVDVIWQDNVIKAILENTASTVQGAIVIAGDGSASDAPMTFTNNRVISNFCNVRLGESYGTGCNTEYYDNTFVKEGPSRGDYRTVNCGYGGGRSTGHEFYDSLFEGGASYDEYNFDGYGTRDFYIGWTLTIQTESNADITIRDVFNSVVWTGQSDGSGNAEAKLYQYRQYSSGRTYHTPHCVTVEKDLNSKTVCVTVDEAKSVQIYFGQTYSLTVNSGSGDGDYIATTVVNIDADTPPPGQGFDAWVGDTAYVADASSAGTTVTMPEGNVEVTATYTDTYVLTVNSGSGDGDYLPGTVVNIGASSPPLGKQFGAWTGDVGTVADVNAPSTTITMPPSDTEITATYTDYHYTLTVVNGSGSGQYPGGAVAPISADPAPSGKGFAMWIGDFAYVADRFQADTTVTMPAADVSVTAVYAFIYTLKVNSGTGDGQYFPGTVVNIDADPAGTDKEFYQWTGQTANVADVEDSSTTVTMPSTDVEITATYTDIPPLYWPGDVNHDFLVGGTDLDYILGDWGHSGTEIVNLIADINNDGFVGGTDLDYVLADWGKTGSPP